MQNIQVKCGLRPTSTVLVAIVIAYWPTYCRPIVFTRMRHDACPFHNKKFELMLTGRAKAYSSSCPQAVTHRSTNRSRRRVTSFQPKRVTNYATTPTPVTWRRLVNDIDLRSPISRKKSIRPPILALKVIQGH